MVEVLIEKMKESGVFALYSAMFFVYHNIESRETTLAEKLDEKMLSISFDLIEDYCDENDVNIDEIDTVNVCCEIRGYCFDNW